MNKIYQTKDGMKLILNVSRSKNDKAGDYVFNVVGERGSTVFIEPQYLDEELGQENADEIRNILEQLTSRKMIDD